jgi:hypothetical protein
MDVAFYDFVNCDNVDIVLKLGDVSLGRECLSNLAG